MGTVTLGCSLPNGLIIRGYQKIKDDKELTGHRMEPTGVSYQIPGPDAGGSHGQAVVDSGFWDDWVSQHNDSDILTRAILFVLSRDDEADPPATNPELVVGDTRRP